MTTDAPSATNDVRKNAQRIDAAAEWRSRLTGVTAALLAFATLSGLAVYLLPFSLFNQFNVVVHTLVGILMLPIVAWFVVRHWWLRRKGRFNHFQLLGYVALTFLIISGLSGVVITWQALVGPRVEYLWDWIHLLTGLGLGIFLSVHLVTIGICKLGTAQCAQQTLSARHLLAKQGRAGSARRQETFHGSTRGYHPAQTPAHADLPPAAGGRIFRGGDPGLPRARPALRGPWRGPGGSRLA